MNKNVAIVLNGYVALSSEERAEFKRKLSDADSYPFTTKDKVKKALNEAHGLTLGPSTESCPCCGK